MITRELQCRSSSGATGTYQQQPTMAPRKSRRRASASTRSKPGAGAISGQSLPRIVSAHVALSPSRGGKIGGRGGSRAVLREGQASDSLPLHHIRNPIVLASDPENVQLPPRRLPEAQSRNHRRSYRASDQLFVHQRHPVQGS